MVPRRSTRSSRSSFSTADSEAAAPVSTSAPALFTHTSRRPSARAGGGAERANRELVGEVEPDHGRAAAERLDLARNVPAPCSLTRYVSATSAPARAAASAIARPMPLDAPVTSTARPASGAALTCVIPDILRGMRLLVSVASATEASAALAGGADIIDAKNPLAGALGAVSTTVLREIHRAVAGARPLTAALGDAADEAAIECAARVFAATGATLVKVGFAGIDRADRAVTLATAAVRGARAGSRGRAGVIVVAYADADSAGSLPPAVLAAVGRRAGAAGVLLDTADKAGPGLRALLDPRALAAWVAAAHDRGLMVALAGKLAAGDSRLRPQVARGHRRRAGRRLRRRAHGPCDGTARRGPQGPVSPFAGTALPIGGT